MVRFILAVLAAGAGLLGLAFLAVSVGAVDIPFDVIWKAIRGAVFPSGQDEPHPLSRIILDLRLPRALLAIMVGAGLGVVGCILQTVTRNDLADPFLFGLSSGAAAGAVLVITVTGDVLGVWTLPIAAFCGGLIASATVLLLMARGVRQDPARLVLTGLAVSFLFLSLTNYMVFAGDQRAAHSVLFWTIGGLGLARWDILPIALAGLLAVGVYGVWKSRDLDALLSGDDTAQTLGVDVKNTRRMAFMVAAFATSAFVSVTGVIGFVGLMVPHLARAITGPLHGRLIILSSLIGACLLLVSDSLARTLLTPQELPIGIITSAIGALFVMSMLRRL
ncbi:FecCD family ABC transporter permease [Coralliovum pocilloporae]|uniref:FecCD family ABC transporter permease n=1 Tax=Coralliovum pocilloporae TaxID=3066369 RepID=UPI00330753A2